jgi:hypothetical protein
MDGVVSNEPRADFHVFPGSYWNGDQIMATVVLAGLEQTVAEQLCPVLAVGSHQIGQQTRNVVRRELLLQVLCLRGAMLSASLLTLVAISCASLGLWRVGTDLDWAGDFVFQNGFLSHWQVWIGVGVGVQYASWRLSRYARNARKREVETVQVAEPSTVRAAVNF